MSISLDQLVAIAAKEARPIVAQLLANESADGAAELLTRQAQDALAGLGLFGENDEAASELPDGMQNAVGSFVDELKDALRKPLPKPTEEDLEYRTQEAALLLMSAWLETIRRRLKRGDIEHLQLNPDVMLPKKADLGDELHGKLMQALDPLVVSTDEAALIMRAVRDRLFKDGPRVELPAGVVLEQSDDGLFASRGG